MDAALLILKALARPDPLEGIPHSETLIAVVLGAFLATLTGFAATQLETVFARRRRGRDAALLLGEVFSTLALILGSTRNAHGRGDPYGSVTMRMLRAARREMDIYDRNRESLVDLKEAKLRVAIQSVMVRLAMPLDGLLDAGSADRATKDVAFEYLMECAAEIPPLITRLSRLSGHSLDGFKREAARAEAAIAGTDGAAPAPR
jgi:hypothetical protein